MKYETRYQVLKIADLVTPPYNPREDIERGSEEYEALRRSILDHDLVEPPVVNLVNMRCIGGNQRLTVLRDLGRQEVLCSVIEQHDELQEKKLCLALNQIKGRWNNDRLGFLLRDDDVMEYETGFDAEEVALYKRLEEVNAPEDTMDDNDTEPEELDEAVPEEEPEDAPEAEEDTGTTLVRIGHLHFKADVSQYRRLLADIRDQGVFEKDEVCKAIKRRLLYG